jgi:hypothetical protein
MRTAAILVAFGLLAGGQALACDYPTERVDRLPNGTTATMDEMLEAQVAIRDYVAAIEAYIECMDEDIDANRTTYDEERLRVMLQRRDAAVEDVREIAEKFNTQVRLYNEAN